MSKDTADSDFGHLQRRLEDSDVEAFEAIFDRLGTPVFRFISGMVSEEEVAHDLTQDTFVKLWEARERATSIESIEAYTFQIARNRVYSYQRTERRRRNRRAEYGTELSDGAPAPSTEVAAREVREKFQGWVGDLPERQREALLLSREKDLSHEEIAEVMEVSPNTVNTHITRAIRTLRERLKSFRPDLH